MGVKLRLIKNLLIVLLIVLLIGCAKQAKEVKPLLKKTENSAGEKAREPVKKASEEKEQPRDIVYVEIHKFTFKPETVNITKGETVIWKNVDDDRHYIKTPMSGFQSTIIKPGEEFRITFYEGGKSYKYVEPGFGSIGYVNVK